MLTQLYKKLNSITALPPTKDNEIIIRNLSHRLLNEISSTEFSEKYNRDKDVIRQSCLNRIRLLNNDIILKSSRDDYVFERYNMTSVVKNTVTACEILLCKTNTEIMFDCRHEVYLEFPLKLILTAIIGIIRFFCESYGECRICFTVKKKTHTTVLLAECVNNKPKTVNSQDDAVSVLKKISEITGGTFLTAERNSGFVCGLSIENRKTNSGNTKYSPDYVELLLDKMSEVHIGLSGLEIPDKNL